MAHSPRVNEGYIRGLIGLEDLLPLRDTRVQLNYSMYRPPTHNFEEVVDAKL